MQAQQVKRDIDALQEQARAAGAVSALNHPIRKTDTRLRISQRRGRHLRL